MTTYAKKNYLFSLLVRVVCDRKARKKEEDQSTKCGEMEDLRDSQGQKIELPPTAYRAARRGAVSAEPFDPSEAANETVCIYHAKAFFLLLHIVILIFFFFTHRL